jgi:hypothetical protein
MAPAAFLDGTQEYWREQGWQSERHEVADGTYMLAGVQSTDGSQQTGLMLVVPDLDDTVTGKHIKYLLSAGAERDVDTVAFTTQGDVTERATSLIEEQSVRYVDAEAVQSAAPPPFDEPTNFTFPNDDSPAGSSTDASQQSEVDSGAAVTREQSDTGSTGASDTPTSAATTGGPVDTEPTPANSTNGGNAPVDASETKREPTPNRSASPADREQAAVNDLPLASGAIMGAVAFLANYLLVTVLYIFEFSNDQGTFTGIAPHEYAGWIFYNAHTVKIEDTTGSEGNLLDILYTATQSLAVPKLAYYVVPVLGLVAAGYVLANQTLGATTDPGVDGAKRGALVAIGYAILTAAAATTVFSVSPPSATGSIAPELDGTAALMAVGYPVVLGGLGGFLAGASR